MNNSNTPKANERQVGGAHYKTDGEQHWDRIYRMFGPGYFIGCITKYVERYQKKNGVEDLEKAKHFLEKLIELENAAEAARYEALQATVKEHLKTIETIVYRIKNTVGWKASVSDILCVPDDGIAQLSEMLDGVSSSDLLRVVQHRGAQDEARSMNEHARSLNGDIPESLEHGVADNENSLVPIDDGTDAVQSSIGAPYASEQTATACSGCGAVQVANVMIHSVDCPRLTDARHLKPDPSGAPNATRAPEPPASAPPPAPQPALTAAAPLAAL